MALAIVVCNAFINAGLPAFTGSYADWALLRRDDEEWGLVMLMLKKAS